MSNYPDVDIQPSMSDYRLELEKDEGYQLFLDNMEEESERERQSETLESSREDRS